MKLTTFLVVLAVLLTMGLWTAAPIHAQDLGSDLAAALAANEQAVSTIRSAETASSPSVARSAVLEAVSEAQAARSSLQSALSFATTDEQRSRINALIDHLDAAINAGLQAQTASDQAISGIAAAVRGEVVEALSELQPFAPEVAPSIQATPPAVSPTPTVPQQLPKAGDGWSDTAFLSFLALAGGASLLVGLRARFTVRPS